MDFKTEKQFWDHVNKIEADVDAGKSLTGQDAAIYLACLFGSTTHGNYEADTLWARANVEDEHEITIKKKMVVRKGGK